jgi:hypothetical protein
MFTDTWRAIRRAVEGLAEASHSTPAYFVIPIERGATSLRPCAPIAVSSAPAAIEVAGSMQSAWAGVLAVAWAGDGPLVLARYGDTGGDGDGLK